MVALAHRRGWYAGIVLAVLSLLLVSVLSAPLVAYAQDFSSSDPTPLTSSAPTPVASSAPAPLASSAPTPLASSAPTPLASSVPRSVSSSVPTPAASSAPTPLASSAPTPLASSAPTPLASSAPTPVASSVPRSVSSSAPYPSVSSSVVSPALSSSRAAQSSSVVSALSSSSSSSSSAGEAVVVSSQSLSTTAPIFAWTFDTNTTALPKYAGSNYTYADSYNGRQGVISLNGVNNYVNLATHTDDSGSNFAAAAIGGSLSFEAWVTWSSFNGFSRILDFGGPLGANDNNLLLGDGYATGQLFFGAVVNSAASWFYSPTNFLALSQWVHVAGTIRRVNSSAAVYTMYVNGSQVGSSSVGAVPATMVRPSSYLGRSNWADPLFRGFIDSVLVYNYSLDAEAIAAHTVVPRVPVFELTFGVDPRIALGLSVTSAPYNWSSGVTPHVGLVDLSNYNSIDLYNVDGLYSVGARVPSVIGGPGWSIATGDRVGWSFEMTFRFKAQTYGYVYFYNGALGIYIQMTIDISGIYLYESTGYYTSSATLSSQALQTNVWYTLVVVVRAGATTTFVNGVAVGSSNGAFLTTPLRVTHSYMFVDGSVDSFRVYDYALTSTEIAAVYRVVSGGGSSAPVSSPSSSSAAPQSLSSVARPTLSSSSQVPSFSSMPPVSLSSSSFVPSSASSAPRPTPVVESPRALAPRHGSTSSYDAAHVRTVSRELLDRPLTLTPLGSTAVDDGLFSWALPFAFRVGAVTTSSVTVSTNGNLQFGGAGHTSYRFVPEQLPKGDGELLPLLSYLFTDLNATSASQLRVASLGVAPERVALLRVTAVGTASNRSAASSIDVLLFEGVNRIEVRYYSIGVFTERTLVALQNADVNDFAVFWNAVALTSDARALLDGSTIVFQPRAAFVEASGGGNSARRLRRRLLFAM